MKNILKLEEAGMFAFCGYALYLLKAEWWFYILLLVGPDISMLGYLGGNKTGAFFYNLFHHKAVALVVFAVGFFMDDVLIQLIGIVLFGHSSLDRMFGYGLKLNQGFKYTHLGMIGKEQKIT